MDREATVERLKEEATERWGERWTIEVSRYADGDFNAHAVQHYGRNDDGHLMQDRIYIAEDGEVIVSR